jgi:cell shape-determining protein MreC
MNYPLKSSNFDERRKASKKRLLYIVVVFLILSLLMFTNPVRNTLFSIASPIWKIRDMVVNSSIIGYFKSKKTLMDEKLALEQKLFLAGNMISMNDVLTNENENLKDLLGRKDIKAKTVLATILVKPPQTPYDSIVIDIGDDNGINVGDKVVANANVYIGEISEVFPHSAKAILYSSPGRKLSVVLGTSQISVESVGVGGGNFHILLPREVEVKEGDVIVIPSITPNVFGIVEKINFQDKDSFQTVLFKSPVNVSELTFVEVVLSN